MTAVPIGLRLRPEILLRSRAIRGDAAAFAAVYERHHQALYRYCRSILQHEQDAQDALQNTMARAFAALQEEHRDFELRPWLFRIAHNEAVSMLRQRRVMAEFDDEQSPSAEVEDRSAVREELRLLQLDLADLPERQRAALVLRELCGLSYVDIGAVLELSPVAVKHAIFDARNALFSSRDGREFACEDVRRKLSDGDGRVLRGRGVRAHVRSCTTCRRFQADLAQRPRALRMLTPPLPSAGAAMLLSQLLGGTAAKLLACAMIVGGGTTLAVETRHARERALADAGERASLPLPLPQAVPATSVSAAVASLRKPSVVPQPPTAGLAPRERSDGARAGMPVSHSIAPPRHATRDAGTGSPAIPVTAREAGLATGLAAGEESGARSRDVPATTPQQAEPATEAGSRGSGGNLGNAENRGNGAGRGKAESRGSGGNRGNAENRVNGADRGKAESRGNGSNRGNAESRSNGADRGNAENPGKAESVGDAAARGKPDAPGAAGKTGEASIPPAADTPADPGPPSDTGPATGEPPARGRAGTPPPAASAHEPPGNDPKAPPGQAKGRGGG